MDDITHATDKIHLESSQISANIFPFPRKIEFHLARYPFDGLCNNGDFKLETLNPNSESDFFVHSNEKSTPKKPDIYQGFENFDSELEFQITLRRIGAGLENLGNTCYMNSVLQCLTYTEPLVAYLQSGKHQISCQIAGFCALCAMQKHISRALESTGRIVSPKYLVSNLRSISRNFRNARQEDAHEYMVNLLDLMHKCCLPSGIPSESSGAYERSLVHRIFGGRLRSQVKCMQCSFCSNKFDPFLDLSLEIMKTNTLHKALMYFTTTEMLDGGEKQYHCQRCNQKVKALKQLTIDKAPYVLTIHLKRFGSHDIGQKIDKKVEFGPTLDMKPFVSGSNEELKYTLYGVLVHAGWSTRSGHYFCFIRTSSGMWYSLDDNRVVQVNELTVLEQKAYMLFYVRDRKISPPIKKPIGVTDSQRKAIASPIATKKSSSSFLNSDKITINGTFDDRLNHTNADPDIFFSESKPTDMSIEIPRASTPATFTGIRHNRGLEPSFMSGNPVAGRSGIYENGKPTAPLRFDTEAASKSGKHLLNGSSSMAETSEAEPSVSGSVKKETNSLTGRELPKSCGEKASKKCQRKLLKYGLSSIRLGDRVILASHLRKHRKYAAKYNRPKNKVMPSDGCSEGASMPSISGSARSSFGLNGVCNGSAKTETQKGVLHAEKGASVLENGGRVMAVNNSVARTKIQDFEFRRDVPRWENHEAYTRRTTLDDVEEGDRSGKSNIGYVLDDWDEEYDRGKRKKVRDRRSKIGFNEAPNPFQEVATKRFKVKQKKLYSLPLLLA